MRYLKLLLTFIRVSLQGDTAYRADFFMGIATALFHAGGELVGLWIVFHNTPSLAGWTAYQILVLLGVFRMMAGAINLFIAPNMRKIMDDIRNGSFDFVLTKPASSQFLVSFRTIQLSRLADVAVGLTLALIGAAHVAQTASISNVMSFAVLLASGVAVIYSLWLVLATTTFWFLKIENIEMVFWNIFEAGRYPIDIYPRALRLTLTYIVPLAFIITLPAGALVGKAGLAQAGIAVVVAAAALAAASAFWRFGVKHYSGASA